MIIKRPGWSLVDIYADEGISGTSLQHRDAFKRLMRDCDAGKVDMIITKSVSRLPVILSIVFIMPDICVPSIHPLAYSLRRKVFIPLKKIMK